MYDVNIVLNKLNNISNEWTSNICVKNCSVSVTNDELKMPNGQSEEFEDTKGVIRIRISKKNRQHNGQKKKYKRTNNDLQNIHIKLKIE